MERIHYGACNLCEAICGLEFRVEGNEILSIRGDDADPLSHGHICPKAVALKDIYEDKDRLRHPMRRVGDHWEEMSWDAAFDLVAEKLLAVHKANGADSIAAYLGNPSVHNYGVMTTSSSFIGPLKTRSRYSATSVDQLPHQLLVMWMYGHQLMVPITDIDRTNYFLVLGANPMASNGSLMTVPAFRTRLKALHARGGKMVVIDPRRSETALVADEHHFIKPGGDAAFLAALLKTILDENLAKPGRVGEFTDGLQEAARAVQALDINVLAQYCNVDAAIIQRIAREFASADGAACYGRMGVSTQRYGTLCQWLIQLINLFTGNLDREGGMLFPQPALDLVHNPMSKPGHFAQWKTRVRGLPEFGGELPVAALAEEIETPGAGQVRALISIAGNPVLSTPNGRRLENALASLDFMVSVDLYMNETTRHADVILPPTCTLEHDHYDLIFHHFAVRNTARFNTPLFEKPEGTMHDWEIFAALGARISAGLGQPVRPSPRPDQIVDMGLRIGPNKLSLDQLKQHPHGIDLGALKPSLPQRLFHKDKRIQAAPSELLQEMAAFAKELHVAPIKDELRLIGRRHVRSNNSWMHNFHRLVKGEARDQLLMHPADLGARGLNDGENVCVRSRVGAVTVAVKSSDEMMPGVVSLPHGWGHHREGTRVTIATAHAGTSSNDLTDETYLDISGNAALNGVLVSVERAA
ncbi:MAG: molybdopterin-dependent oxidoreductase [Pseudomonadota bacterium]